MKTIEVLPAPVAPAPVAADPAPAPTARPVIFPLPTPPDDPGAEPDSARRRAY